MAALGKTSSERFLKGTAFQERLIQRIAPQERWRLDQYAQERAGGETLLAHD